MSEYSIGASGKGLRSMLCLRTDRISTGGVGLQETSTKLAKAWKRA